MTSADFCATHEQSHRRMIEVSHLARRITPFLIERATLNAASPNGMAIGEGIEAVLPGKASS